MIMVLQLDTLGLSWVHVLIHTTARLAKEGFLHALLRLYVPVDAEKVLGLSGKIDAGRSRARSDKFTSSVYQVGAHTTVNTKTLHRSLLIRFHKYLCKLFLDAACMFYVFQVYDA